MGSLPAPGPVSLAPHSDEEQRQALRLDHQDTPYEPDERERHALQRAAETGRQAACWVRTPAGRQTEQAHARALTSAAEAIVPGGDGEALDGPHRSRLLAPSVIGPAYDYDRGEGKGRQTLPELTAAEKVTVVAVRALAAAMPDTVLGYYPPELDTLAHTLTAAIRAGQST
ncbi:hypothetical protein [Kitasatospora sp. NPDC090308]|uniref:hypothetical protein n=1 Tax=Kitasatospora sp. NPDC090308 TaxID=3364082 RepID=UPI0038209C44